eukprot:XP_027303417.1 uncharacterized protein LOC113840873 isoform X2 [Anas platyrhynchos]
MLLLDGDSEDKLAPMELPVKNNLEEGTGQAKEEAQSGDENNVEQEKEEGGNPLVAPLRVRLDHEKIAVPSAPPADRNAVHTSSDGSFCIPLHPDDTKRFALTIPSLNNMQPAARYEWVVLPQGTGSYYYSTSGPAAAPTAFWLRVCAPHCVSTMG